MITMETQARSISVTDTAKLIRVALAKHFPRTTFAVHSKKYSGGASINIHWTDGPRTKDVERISNGFEGTSFDGMNDLASNQQSWLTPSGIASLAHRPDSYGGSIPEYVSDAPHPNAEMVSFMADYVFCNRHISDFETKEAAALAMIRTHCQCEGIPPCDRFGGQWGDQLARHMVQDQGDNETMQAAFDRVVLRNG